MAMTEPTAVSPPHRYPGGQKKQDRSLEARHQGGRTLWKRFRRTDWYGMMERAEDPMWGTVPGLLFLDGVLTETQADGCKLFAELAAKYDRYHGISRRTAKSPAYERSYGQDDEVQKHVQNGTTPEYERRGETIRRKWHKALSKIPPHLMQAFIDVCIEDREIHSTLHEEFAKAAGELSRAFGVIEDARTKNDRKLARSLSSKKKMDIVNGALHAIENYFRGERATPKLFKLLMDAPEGERGICAYGTKADGEWVRHSVTVKTAKTFLDAELDSLLVRAAEQRGWKERDH